jgi:hypothetical protein
MPYIKPEQRAETRDSLMSLICSVKSREDRYRDSMLSQMIYSLVFESFGKLDYVFSKSTEPLGSLVAFVRQLPDNDKDGALNYLVSELVAQSMKPVGGWRYHNLHRCYAITMSAGADFHANCRQNHSYVYFYAGNACIRAYGVFMAAAAEFYRRLPAPYEDLAIAKNGDIEAYKS